MYQEFWKTISSFVFFMIEFFFLKKLFKDIGPQQKKRGDFPEVGGVTFRDGGCFSRLKFFFSGI